MKPEPTRPTDLPNWPGYRCEQLLGRGASGSAYRATDLRTGDRVAIKRCHPELRELAAHEAGILAGIDFPGVVGLRDATVDPADGSFLAAFDLIEGRDLLSATAESGLEAAATLFADILRALAFVHRRFIVHRDLKPQNLLVAGAPEGARATVIDFGLATGSSDPGARAAGTLAYLAPEVLAGEPPDPRSDLYSFGVVLYQVLARRLPGEGLSGVDIARLHASTDLALPVDVAQRFPAGMADLVKTLLRRDPALRLSTAEEVLESLARGAGVQLPLETEETLCGRVRSMSFPLPEGLFDRVVDHGRAGGCIAVTLPPGSGMWLKRLRVAWAEAGRPVTHAVVGDGRTDSTSVLESAHGPGVVLIECAGAHSEQEEARVADLLRAAAERSRQLAVVVSLEADQPFPACLAANAPPRLDLPLPTGRQVRELVNQALGIVLSPAELRRLRIVTEYSPLTVVEGLSALIRSRIIVAEGSRPQLDRARLLDRVAAESCVRRAEPIVDALLEADRTLLQALALPRLPVPAVVAENLRVTVSGGSSPASLADLQALGLVERDADSGALVPGSEALAVALLRRLAPAAARDLRLRVAALLLGQEDVDPECQGEAALLLLDAGNEAEALPHLVEAGASLRRSGRAAEGRRYLERALGLCPAEHAPRERLRVLRWLADCESLEGRNAGAERLAREAVTLAGDPLDLGGSFVVLARTLLRGGDSIEAERAISAGLAVTGIDRTTRALLLTTRSMLYRMRQDHSAAAAAAEEALAAVGAEPSLEKGAALMCLANAQIFLGRIDDAVASYRAAEQLGKVLKREDMTALAVANVGRLLFEHGRIEEAIAILEPVLQGFERSGSIRHAENLLLTLMLARNALGDISGTRALGLKGRSFFGDDSSQENRAMFLRHLADAELRAGNCGEAERLARESVAIREEVSTAEVVSVGLAALGRVLAWTGRSQEARKTLARSLRLAGGAIGLDAQIESHAAAADLHLHEDRPCAALLAARRAVRRARNQNPPRRLIAAAALECLALLGRDDPAGALCLAEEVLDQHPPDRRGADAGLFLGARAAALAAVERWVEAEPEFERALSALAAEGHSAERARVLLLRAGTRLRVAERDRDAASAEQIDRLLTVLSRVRADLSEARAIVSSLSYDAAAVCLGGAQSRLDSLESLGGAAGASRTGLERRIQAMGRLLEINKAVNSELDPRRLLNLILDEAIELCGARRGFLILVQGRKIDVRVARNFAEQDIQNPEFQFSHSVARQVAFSGEPIQTSNALHDQRLRSIASIAELRVTSILCVPLRSQDQVLGSIYLDHPDVIDRFDEGDLELLSDFAAAAGIALERARLYQENIERAGALASAKQEIERLNAELMKTVADQARELDAAKETIEAGRSDAVRRYDYRNIVTQSSRMEDVLRLLDRITETDFPVLIQGESGTGKELVARAIHYNGPRAAANFVSINCAAVAEPLIEAELFGYMKGAFTGADRDRKGLFEVADGGTLFLDEIGDMSPEVQKRLLRVVQYGEFYRVGGKEPVNVNVRVISATNRDLRQLMSVGQFREDLFYRLSVAPVHLPPVRERSGDVSLLIRHFMDELVKEHLAPRKSFSPEAMATLERYAWPGNVREIQNEVKRLLLFRTDRQTVEPEDLPPAIREAAGSGSEAAPRTLREMLEDQERRIVREVMEQAGGNKTEAARRLGVSPRGLYKILDRLGLAGSS